MHAVQTVSACGATGSATYSATAGATVVPRADSEHPVHPPVQTVQQPVHAVQQPVQAVQQPVQGLLQRLLLQSLLLQGLLLGQNPPARRSCRSLTT
jgi:hypothetical protein